MKHIKQCLDVFLDDEAPGVLAIKGDWGAGKTYFVTKYLQGRTQLREKLVSFVSLFGLGSIEDVRRQIIPSAMSAKTLSKGKGKPKFEKLIGLARKLPKVADLEQIYQAVENQITRDLLVVFDDVERKGKDLSLKSFFGLVNFLSEHANCKIIVILNEDQLAPGDKEELDLFREKLLDREILFAPGYEENARLFFYNKSLFEHALAIFCKCECRNLRVIKRCYQNTVLFEDRFKQLGIESKEELLRQVILLSCLFYQYGVAIDFKQLGAFTFSEMFSEREGREKPKGAEILKKAGFYESDFDDVILSFLGTGIIDAEGASALLNKENRSASREAVRRKQKLIYKTVNTNFCGDAEGFLSELTGLLDAHMHDLAWNDVTQAIHYLTAFGFKGDTKRWIDDYILHHTERFSYRDCDNLKNVASTREAKEAIIGRRNALLKSKHPRDIIYSIAENSGWNPEDVVALNTRGVEFFVNWFKEERDEKLLDRLARFVKIFNPRASDPEMRQVGEKVYSAFAKIAHRDNFIRGKLIEIVGISPEDLQEQLQKAGNESAEPTEEIRTSN